MSNKEFSKNKKNIYNYICYFILYILLCFYYTYIIIRIYTSLYGDHIYIYIYIYIYNIYKYHIYVDWNIFLYMHIYCIYDNHMALIFHFIKLGNHTERLVLRFA